RQLKPALDELCDKSFLSGWILDRGSEGELKVRFRASVESVRRSKTSSLGYLVRQLTEREIPEPEAHRTVSGAEDPEEILSRLSYTDQVVRRGGIENPVGFRIAYLRERRPVPEMHRP